jgi:GNAT superfamily N-acetyltransferase
MLWQIRSFEPEDASAVQDLFVRVNRELAPPQLRDEFERYIALSLREEIGRIGEYYDGNKGRSFWVAVDGERLIGNYGLEPSGAGAFELRRMYVEPSLRRQGLARAMLGHAEKTCLKQGGSELCLSTSEIQTAAITLYQVSGYQLVRDEISQSTSNKTLGHGLRRFHFRKRLTEGS